MPLPKTGIEELEQPADQRAVLRRVKLFSLSAYLLLAVVYLAAAQWRSWVGLTCSAAVVMINFQWLESMVGQILQPQPRPKTWSLVLRALARFALFGAALSIAIIFARSDALSVLLGFSVLVAGIVTEAVYSAMRSLRS